VVASPLYRDGAAPSGPAGARSVRYEASLVRQTVYRDPDGAMRKFVPVVLPGDSVENVPAFLWPSPPAAHTLTALTRDDVAALAAALGHSTTTDLRHELSLRVTVSGGEVACRADLSGTALGTRSVPVPYGAEQLWEALELAPEPAAAKLHGFGRRLGRVLLDEPALRTVAALIDAPGSSLDVVVETRDSGLPCRTS
jgi:hypothetical protein